jgi:error-prone DNA polymerase
MHPCGVIISNASLLDRLPVQPTPAGYPMVQADKEDVEDLGLLKLDVLGVRMQSAMAHAVAEIRRTTGRRLDLDNPDHVDLNDRLAFEMIQASDTVGLFQLDSVSTPAVLHSLLHRLPGPAPLRGGMTVGWCDRHRDRLRGRCKLVVDGAPVLRSQ